MIKKITSFFGKVIKAFLILFGIVICIGIYQGFKAGENNVNIEEKYVFIDSKIDQKGDKMDLYIYDSNLTINDLKEFIFTKKIQYKKDNGSFYFIVFFNKKENAAFPKNPFSARYNLEDDVQKNIKAIYQLNNLNSYSKLDIYPTNSLESVSEQFSI